MLVNIEEKLSPKQNEYIKIFQESYKLCGQVADNAMKLRELLIEFTPQQKAQITRVLHIYKYTNPGIAFMLKIIKYFA